MKHDCYLRTIFTKKDRKKAAVLLARSIRAALKEGEIEFDAFACTGVSGLAMASILADKLDKELIVVRKRSDDSHSVGNVEGPETTKKLRYLFVDDFVSSGKTFRSVLDALQSHEDGQAHKCMGTVFYQSFGRDFYTPRILRDKGTFPNEKRHHFGALVSSYACKTTQTNYETYIPALIEDDLF